MKLKTRFTTLLATATLATAALTASAEGHRHGERAIAHLDTDGDQQLSIEEFRFPGERMLTRADTDGDGAVTRDEFAAHFETGVARRQAEQDERIASMRERMEQRFAEMDSNGDYAVTPDEARMAVFSRMDQNQDGYLSVDEIKPPRGEHRGKRGKWRKRDFSD